MTDPAMSPAQKIAAFNDQPEVCGLFDDNWVEHYLAAAVRADLLAIAAELEGKDDG
jgi:hypothetical protein